MTITMAWRPTTKALDIDKGVIESGVAYIKGKSNRIAFWEFISGILNLTIFYNIQYDSSKKGLSH